MIRRRPISRALPALMSVLAALALLPSLSGCTLELDYDKYAIVFGISDYPGTQDDLQYTDDDARELADLLGAQGYQVILRVTDADDSQLLLDFDSVAQIAGPEDLFLFYFSGHGGQVPASSGTAEKTLGSDSLDEVLVLVDDGLTKAVNLRDDQLAQLLRTIPCVRRIVILDACNSGGFIGNVLEKDGIQSDFSFGSEGIFTNLSKAIYLYTNFDGDKSDISPADALVIAASGEREESFEGLYEHGLMTYFLLKSAIKGDLNGDGYITVSESYYYIYRNINANWNNTWTAQAYDVFFPHVSGGPIDYILFTK